MGGTNRKTTVARVKDYVLGGGQGANFSAINVSGMTTSQSVDAEQLDVSGISSLGQVSANTINVTGIVTASDFRAASIKKVNGGLIPLVGVSSATHAGIVTAFKFNGTGLENFVVEDEMATITISGVAASTYTTNQTITAVQNQTTFTFGAGYTDGFVDVYLNGVRLVTGTDYTAEDGATVVLSSGSNAGDEVEIVSFKELGDVISVHSLKTSGDLNVTGIATATGFSGNLTGVAVTATTFTGDLTGDTTGTHTGNVTGAVTGNVTGNLTGDVTGDVTGDLTGDLTGNVTGNVTGDVTGSITDTCDSTIAYLNSTTVNVGAGLTVGGNAVVEGNLTVNGTH